MELLWCRRVGAGWTPPRRDPLCWPVQCCGALEENRRAQANTSPPAQLLSMQQGWDHVHTLSQQFPETCTWRVSCIYYTLGPNFHPKQETHQAVSSSLLACFSCLDFVLVSSTHPSGCVYLIPVLRLPFYLKNTFTTTSSISEPTKSVNSLPPTKKIRT